MRIAYRRMSGAIGFTEFEVGTRGLWLEKRVALVRVLRERGHIVDYVNRMTKFSELADVPVFGPKTHDVLFVEFGSSNTVFYGKDLAETAKMVQQHVGPIVFLNDDPDLPYRWKSTKDTKRWSVWMNATRPQAFGGQPESVKSFDFPFSLLLPYREPKKNVRQVLTYIGRPLGRKTSVMLALKSGADIEWVGRPGDWKGYGVEVVPAPTQAQRADYYAGVLGCLSLMDAKHKRLGWRTGRAYHALHAGTPAMVEQGSLPGFQEYKDEHELMEHFFMWRSDPKARMGAWKAQRLAEQKAREVLDQTLAAHEL